MLVKNIIQEDFANYKTCSMFIGFPSCTWKCERDCGLKGLCQNAELAKAPTIAISMAELLLTYQKKFPNNLDFYKLHVQNMALSRLMKLP